MEREIIVYGHVNREGDLSIYNRDAFVKSIREHYKNKSIQITLTDRFYSFSDKHRSYYFGVLLRQIKMAWESYGVIKSMGDIDEEMRYKFLYFEELNVEKGEMERHIHTLKKDDTNVSKKMMREYIEKCIIWTIQNLDWAVPYPSEEFLDDDMTDHQQKTKNIGVNDKSTF